MNSRAPHTVIDLRGATTPAMERKRRYATAVRPRSVQPQTPPVLHPQPAPRVSTRLILAPFARMALVGALILGGYEVQPWVASSLAYFSDTEAAPASVAASSILDIEAGEDGSSDIMCGGDTSFPVTVDFTSTRAASYEVQALYKDGDVAFCELLDVEATFDGLEQYEGNLIGGAGLYVGGLTATGTWDLDVSLGTEGVSVPDGTTCSVDLVFRAWCPLLGAYGSGFHDEDRVTLTLTKNGCTGGHCEEPCTGGCGDVIVEVENSNSAEVENTVLIETNTGGNSANGGAGGNGGSSGQSGEGGEGGTGSTGNGGTGGNGGQGGTVVTGSTNASVNISQTINSNSTTITTSCSGCCTSECPGEPAHPGDHSDAAPTHTSTRVTPPDARALLETIQSNVSTRLGR